MIDQIHEFIGILKDFNKNLPRYVIEEAGKEEPLIKKLVTIGQLYQGLKADGTEILPPYTARTIQIKRAKSQPFDRVTLQDTGDFYRSIKVRFHKTRFRIWASDPKTKKLMGKYSPEILGLTRENIKILGQAIKPRLITRLKKELNA